MSVCVCECLLESTRFAQQFQKFAFLFGIVELVVELVLPQLLSPLFPFRYSLFKSLSVVGLLFTNDGFVSCRLSIYYSGFFQIKSWNVQEARTDYRPICSIHTTLSLFFPVSIFLWMCVSVWKPMCICIFGICLLCLRFFLNQHTLTWAMLVHICVPALCCLLILL